MLNVSSIVSSHIVLCLKQYILKVCGGTDMTMIKNSVVELFILLLLACTVFIYKLPSTMNTWLLNSIVIVVMGVCILRIALKMMNHK